MSLRTAVLLALALQDQATQAQSPVDVHALSGEIQVWRQKTRKIERTSTRIAVQPEDRLGSPAGAVSRISIGEVILILRGVDAGASSGLSAQFSGKKLLLKLHKGSAVVESLETDVSVETPHGKIEGKTVYFLLEVQNDRSRIVAIDGPLSFTTTLGELTLEAGESAAGDGKKPPAKLRETVAEKDLSWSSPAESPANLVQNPGFEDDLTEWLGIEHQGRKLLSVDPKTVRSGKKAAKISLPNLTPGKDTGNRSWLLFEGHYGVLTAGNRYLFRTWVRGEDYTCDGKPGTIRVALAWSVKDQAFKGEFKKTVPVVPGAWTCVRFFVTPQADGFELYISPGTEGKPVNGTLWFDDFFLAPLPEKK
jgi:hypothetical protein